MSSITASPIRHLIVVITVGFVAVFLLVWLLSAPLFLLLLDFDLLYQQSLLAAVSASMVFWVLFSFELKTSRHRQVINANLRRRQLSTQTKSVCQKSEMGSALLLSHLNRCQQQVADFHSEMQQPLLELLGELNSRQQQQRLLALQGDCEQRIETLRETLEQDSEAMLLALADDEVVLSTELLLQQSRTVEKISGFALQGALASQNALQLWVRLTLPDAELARESDVSQQVEAIREQGLEYALDVVEQMLLTYKQVEEFHHILDSQLDGVEQLTEEASMDLMQNIQQIESAAEDSMHQVRKAITDSASLSQCGQSRVSSIQNNIDDLRAYVDERKSDNINHSQQIEQVLQEVGKLSGLAEMVKNIAFQTNILALNASIEAARAGQAGKGFSVVAGEVRRLSEQSEEAANHIGEGIEKAIGSAHQQMDYLLDEERMANENRRLTAFVTDLSQMAGMYAELENLNQTLFDQTSSNVEKITSLTVETFARIQFQDITRQRLEQIKTAHEMIDRHIMALPAAILEKSAFYALDGLELDALYEGYYMEDQRQIHQQATGMACPTPQPELPKIELF